MIEQLDALAKDEGLSADVLLVNDGSSVPPPAEFPSRPPVALRSISVLHLKKNLGHQRALAVGFVHLFSSGLNKPVVVMDGDGEDSPSNIPALLRMYTEHGEMRVVFAARAKRAEGYAFQFFYQVYRTMHMILVGFDVRLGNFSIIPPATLRNLVVTSDIWNHYAAAVINSKILYTTLPVNRVQRLSGQSKMGFVALVLHGLSAMSVYSTSIAVRLLTTMTCVMLLLGALLALAAAFSAVQAAFCLAVALLVTFQTILLTLLFTFQMLASRSRTLFIPVRDAPVYADRVEVFFDRAASATHSD